MGKIAEVTFRGRKDGSRVEAGVPADVRDFLNVQDGDRVIFEDATPEALERAAKGDSFVIMRRATRPGEVRRLASVKLVKTQPPPQPQPPEPVAQPEQVEGAVPQLEPFDKFVRDRCGRAGSVEP